MKFLVVGCWLKINARRPKLLSGRKFHRAPFSSKSELIDAANWADQARKSRLEPSKLETLIYRTAEPSLKSILARKQSNLGSRQCDNFNASSVASLISTKTLVSVENKWVVNPFFSICSFVWRRRPRRCCRCRRCRRRCGCFYSPPSRWCPWRSWRPSCQCCCCLFTTIAAVVMVLVVDVDI